MSLPETGPAQHRPRNRGIRHALLVASAASFALGAVAGILVWRGIPREGSVSGSEPPPTPAVAAPREHPEPDLAAARETSRAEEPIAVATSPERPPSEPEAEIGGDHPEGFLPYPNAGVADFERKYAGLDGGRLLAIGEKLNLELSDRALEIANVRFEMGWFESAEGRLSDGLDGVQRGDTPAAAGNEPVGLGNVWPVSRFPMSNGRVQTQTVYLTEAEFPEVFAKQDELLWVLRRSARLREEE